MAVKFLDSITIDGDVGVGKNLDVDGSVTFKGGTVVEAKFQADSYISSANGPFGAQPGINAFVQLRTGLSQVTLTFASGLLIGYRCEGEDCPRQPETR